jgi:hypothetical protein
MTVYIEKPSVNLREELASLRNQGGYKEQQFYFDGLITNGTFDADTDWTKGTGWTISGGELVASSVASNVNAMQTFDTEIGKTYSIKADCLTLTSGNVRLYHREGGGGSYGAYETFVSGQTATLSFTATTSTTQVVIYPTSTSSGTFDNVSVFETDGTDVVHRMPKGWVPLHVYEDGLLQREGAANDYTVVYDGFDYYVKPAVAPGATTQTCVIGVRK